MMPRPIVATCSNLACFTRGTVLQLVPIWCCTPADPDQRVRSLQAAKALVGRDGSGRGLSTGFCVAGGIPRRGSANKVNGIRPRPATMSCVPRCPAVMRS
jgi:hypothetical protein